MSNGKKYFYAALMAFGSIIFGMSLSIQGCGPRVSELPKDAPSAVEQQQIAISGEIVCLPSKGRNSIQTLECAFGLLGTDGKHYGLTNLPQQDFINGKITTGRHIEVSGMLSHDPSSKYDIAGTIDVGSYSLKNP